MIVVPVKLRLNHALVYPQLDSEGTCSHISLWKTLSNHVFEDLRKPKAPNTDDVAELRYRTLDNIHDMGAVPGLMHHDVMDVELHNVSVEEPKSFKDADGDPN